MDRRSFLTTTAASVFGLCLGKTEASVEQEPEYASYTIPGHKLLPTGIIWGDPVEIPLYDNCGVKEWTIERDQDVRDQISKRFIKQMEHQIYDDVTESVIMEPESVIWRNTKS